LTAKWVCTLSMLVGRLEVYSVVVLFFPEFWRK
jgi:trk system potassium uptake protein TrkH